MITKRDCQKSSMKKIENDASKSVVIWMLRWGKIQEQMIVD